MTKSHKERGFVHIVLKKELRDRLDTWKKPDESYADVIEHLVWVGSVNTNSTNVKEPRVNVNTDRQDSVNIKEKKPKSDGKPKDIPKEVREGYIRWKAQAASEFRIANNIKYLAKCTEEQAREWLKVLESE